jgi:hypothetical protein
MKRVRFLFTIATVVAIIALTAPAANAAVFTYPVMGTSTGCSEDVYVSGTYRMIINNAIAESGDRYVQTVRFILNAEAVGVTSGTKYEIVGVLGQSRMEYPVDELTRTTTLVSTSKVIGNGEVYTVRIVSHVTNSADAEPIAIVDSCEVSCT